MQIHLHYYKQKSAFIKSLSINFEKFLKVIRSQKLETEMWHMTKLATLNSNFLNKMSNVLPKSCNRYFLLQKPVVLNVFAYKTLFRYWIIENLTSERVLCRKKEIENGGAKIWTRDLSQRRRISWPLDQSFISRISQKNLGGLMTIQYQKIAHN